MRSPSRGRRSVLVDERVGALGPVEQWVYRTEGGTACRPDHETGLVEAVGEDHRAATVDATADGPHRQPGARCDLLDRLVELVERPVGDGEAGFPGWSAGHDV